MVKYASIPQLRYGGSSRLTDGVSRYDTSKAPPGAMPISSAPENGAFYAVEANGQHHLAIRHRGTIQRLKEFKDFRGGASQYRMDGMIANTPWWVPVQRAK